MSANANSQDLSAKGLDLRVSVHDVMPETIAPIIGIMTLLKEKHAAPVQLLVVPGLAWTDEGLSQLRQWQEEGHELVGHGWTHQTSHIRGLKHRLHALFISRNVAEHLSLDEAGLVSLLAKCHGWFAAHGLSAPTFYVPPAWALGGIGRSALSKQAFAYVETLSGVLNCRTGQRERQYLVGFEADTQVRKYILKSFNALNIAMARWRNRPLRIAIHPHDLSLHLGKDVARLVSKV